MNFSRAAWHLKMGPICDPETSVTRYSRIACHSNMGPIGCLETSVDNYHSKLRNVPWKGGCNLYIGGTLNITHNLQYLKNTLCETRRGLTACSSTVLSSQCSLTCMTLPARLPPITKRSTPADIPHTTSGMVGLSVERNFQCACPVSSELLLFT